ncbi:MAG: hypothetical protein LBS88_13290 [Tannerellaceae bacterium]|jgi:hypothetical protein|nr:hypothetical protein [Tannerellaceae bacterium]
MGKTVLILILCTVICTGGFSQTGESKQRGFQFSFIYPVSTNGISAPEYTNTVSFNMLTGISENEKAFTFGGLVNIIRRDAYGLQFAGLYNHIGNNGKGLLFSGLASYAGKNYTGLQFSGLANISGDISGLQFAGLVNIAKDVKGVQFAGLVNVADNSDYPIGIVNLIKNGEKGIAVTYNETGSMLLSFRSGGRVTYGIIGYGYNHRAGKKSWVVEGGLGMHINCSPHFRINNEIKTENLISSENTTFKTGYHLSAAYKFIPQIEVFAGPDISYLYSNDTDNAAMFPRRALWKKHDSSELQQIYIGYQLGIMYLF